MKDLCAEICGSRDALDDRVITVLSLLTEQMVDNIVDYSCMYAQHRKSDTLEKQDIQYATSKLFPDVSKEHKVKNVQLVIDQQVMQNYPLAGMPSTSSAMYGHLENAPLGQFAGMAGMGGPQQQYQGTAIGVGGQISTHNYKSQLMKVKRQQEQTMALSSVKESLELQAQNINNQYVSGANAFGQQAGVSGNAAASGGSASQMPNQGR